MSATESVRNYDAWKAERRSILASASKPTLQARTITSLRLDTAGFEPGAEPSVEVHVLERTDIDRPGGRRFGTLVHALLALIDLDSAADDLKATAVVQGRIVGATEKEIEAAVAAALRAVAHPVMRRAANAARRGWLRREVPATLQIQDGSLIEGVVDLAFREEIPDFAGWTVVDFKTDRELEGARDRYVRQVQLYSRAVSASTNLPSRGALLVI